MIFNVYKIIENYLKDKDTVFTLDEFLSYMKSKDIELPEIYANYLLGISDFVFSLADNKFITRACVFLGQFFSFKPSKDEIECGHFIIGHRCMPFANPDVTPDNICVLSNNHILKSELCKFPTKFALDRFALYVDEYALPYVLNDIGNKELTLSSVRYSLPSEVSLMSWKFSDLKGGKNINYGDRVICRVINWEKSIIEMEVVHESDSLSVVTNVDIERADWYSDLEAGLLDSFDRLGPMDSIEEQLAYLYLENLTSMCKKSCGSVEEFLKHTSKISFEPYGLETRLWRTGEVVPFEGKWNSKLGKKQLLDDYYSIFIPEIIDVYIKDNLFRESTGIKIDTDSIDELMDSILYENLSISQEERNGVLLKIKKRRDILKRSYNPFIDYAIAEIRNRALVLFSKVGSLLCAIGYARGDISDFPQQELVILSQIYGRLLRLIEEFGNEFNYSIFPVDDVSIYLDGIEDTFREIYRILGPAIEKDNEKGFELV